MFSPQLRLLSGSSCVKWRNFFSQTSIRSDRLYVCACSYKSSFRFHTCNSPKITEGNFPLLKTKNSGSVLNDELSVSMGLFRRNLSSSSDTRSSKITEGEKQLKQTIQKCFPNATNIEVEDISGGCGSMYSVFIEAPDFRGLSTVKQHLLVNKALQQEIKSMHGIRIQTAASKEV